MTTETTTQTTETQTTGGDQQITLEDVYKTFDVKTPETGTQQTHAPVQPAVRQPPEIKVPDPYDQEGVKSWMMEQARSQSVLSNSLQQVMGTLSQQQQATQIQRLEEDIGKAVEKVNETVGLPQENKKLLRWALDEKANNDPRFKQLWNNRAVNPIAWDRALQAVSQELAKQFSVKVDPQVKADRAALKLSQSQSATTSNAETEPHPLEKATGADFERLWAQMRLG